MARTLDDTAVLRLIDALAPGNWVSGAALAAASGVTRQALAQRIRHLEEWQLAVESRPGLGYRLTSPVERLDMEAIRAGLPPQWRDRVTVEVLPRTDSTNAQAMQRAAAGDPLAVLAEMQTAGRGRRGREWRSPFGANLYLSLGWTFAAWPPQLGTLSLAAGVCCVRALRALGIEGVTLKWPNDLWIDRAKLGGILIEQRGEAGGHCRVVIGVGLNVAMQADQAGVIDQPWTTLAEHVDERTPPARNTVAASLLTSLLEGLDRFAIDGYAAFASEWTACDLTRGRTVVVRGGDDVFEGIARGVDDSGALQVDTAGGRRAVHAGDVSLRLA